MSGANQDRDAEIIRLYTEDEMSMLAVSRTTGVSYDIVRRVIERAGVQRPHAVSPARRAAVIEACTTGGLTYRQAGDAYGLHASTVCRLLGEDAAVPRLEAGLLAASEAASLLGITAREMGALARAGLVGHVRRAAHGNRLYVADDVRALVRFRAGRRQ